MISTYDLLDVKKLENELAKSKKWDRKKTIFDELAPYHYAQHRQVVKEECQRFDLPLPIGGGTSFNGVETLAEQNSAATVANTTVQTSLILNDDRGPFAPPYFNRIGAELLFEAGGVVSTTGTPTLVIRFTTGTAWNATAITTTTMAGTNANTATATASGLANADYFVRGFGTTRTVAGTTSTIILTGYLLGLVFSTTQPFANLKNATPPTAATVDLSVNVYYDLNVAWGTASASNTITNNFYNLRSMN